jgi:hypothetical protein
MSLCLALLLAAVAIDWWQGWKPFKYPFQMPGKPWLTRLSTIRSLQGDHCRKAYGEAICQQRARRTGIRRARRHDQQDAAAVPAADRRVRREDHAVDDRHLLSTQQDDSRIA